MFEVLLLEIARGGTREGCVPLQPGCRNGEESQRLPGWDNRQCSGQRSSFHGGRPGWEGRGRLRRWAVCGGCGAGVRCVWCWAWGWRVQEGGPSPLLPPLSPSLQQRVEEGKQPPWNGEAGEQVKGAEWVRGEGCRPQQGLKGWGRGGQESHGALPPKGAVPPSHLLQAPQGSSLVLDPDVSLVPRELGASPESGCLWTGL